MTLYVVGFLASAAILVILDAASPAGPRTHESPRAGVAGTSSVVPAR